MNETTMDVSKPFQQSGLQHPLFTCQCCTDIWYSCGGWIKQFRTVSNEMLTIWIWRFLCTWNMVRLWNVRNTPRGIKGINSSYRFTACSIKWHILWYNQDTDCPLCTDELYIMISWEHTVTRNASDYNILVSSLCCLGKTCVLITEL